MRSRSIKPGICDNELLGTADPFYTLLFERLWMIADRLGRLEDRPMRIKAQAFPYRDGLDVKPMLDWLAANGFIVRYEVNGEKFIQINAFLKHQSPHKNEQPSNIPPPPEQSTTKAVPENDQGGAMDALTPSSLTPDSGLLTADSRLLTPDPPLTGGPERAGEGAIAAIRPSAPAVPLTVPFAEFQAWRARYPAGTFPDVVWQYAERNYCRLRDGGATPEQLAASAEAYAAQIAAKGRTGTQFVKAPDKFLADGYWRGPFPLPAPTAEPKRENAFERFNRNLDERDARIHGKAPIEGEVIHGNAQLAR